MTDMRTVVSDLQVQYQETMDRAEQIESAITSLQKICPHKYEDGSDAFEYQGHDSHKDYYECALCQKKERY